MFIDRFQFLSCLYSFLSFLSDLSKSFERRVLVALLMALTELSCLENATVNGFYGIFKIRLFKIRWGRRENSKCCNGGCRARPCVHGGRHSEE